MRLKGKVNFRSLVITLSAIVVFVTTYLLILPAITLDKEQAIQQGGVDVAVEETIDDPVEQAVDEQAGQPADEEAVQPAETEDKDAPETGDTPDRSAPDRDEVKLLTKTKKLTADSDESAGFTVSAIVDKADKVPEDVSLQAAELTKDTEGFDYDEHYKEALKALKKEDSSFKSIRMIRFYDISLESDAAEEPVEPDDKVSVTIEYEKGIRVSDADNIRIVHFGEDNTEVLDPEDNKIETTVDKKNQLTGASFETDGFSEYAVVEVETIEETVIASDGHNYKISVTYGEDASVPEGAKLEVTEILQSEEASDEATEYETYLEKTREALGMESGVFEYARFFDIRIVDENGEKVQIDAPVDVKIELADKEGGNGSENNTQVVHFSDGAEKGDVVTSTTGDTKKGQVVTFEAEGFSVYAIVEGPSATPQNWERMETVADVIEQGKEGENRTGGLYVGHIGGYYFMNTTVSTTQNGVTRIGIKKTTPPKVTPPTDEASKYYIEQVEGTSNQVYAYCYSANGQKQYVYNGGNNSLSFTTEANKTAFTINVDSEGRFTLQNGTWYWNMQGGQPGTRFCSYNKANDENSYLYFWKLKDDTGGDPYGLDGLSYTLLTWDGGKTGKALTGDPNADHEGNLCAEFLTVMTNKDDNSLQLFVPNNSSEQVTPWTFHWKHDDCYKLSAVIYTRDSEGKQIEAGTKYLKIDGNTLSMVDNESDASEIRVVPGTGIHEGQIMLKSGSSTLTYSGKFEEGFNINSGAGKEYLYLAEGEPEEELVDYYRTYTADKISVSSEKLTPDPPTAEYPDGVPKKVIIYTRVWNGSGYRYFAIDGNGTMVPCFDNGNEIEWIGSSLDELQWELTEYGTWEGDKLTPNYYYELQNTYTKKYLAPQISSDQVLSDNKIGLNLNGRRNGQYYTPVLAWDGSNYSFASIKADLDAAGEAEIEPCYRSDGMDIYFAIINELDKDDTLHEVPTVDNSMYGITMKLANYTTYQRGDGCDTSKEQTDVLGDKKYDKDKPTQGLLSTNLDENGYPTAVRTTKSLGELYADAEDVNHLFVESTYKATGYYEYDSAQNFASLKGATSGDFTVYQEIGTHDRSDRWTLKHGQFLPYNNLQPGHFATTNGRNTHTPTGELDHNDPRYNEQLYLVDNPEFTFGVELTAGFYQTPSGLDAWGHDIIFEFSGDDDFWLYVDGELVIDLGGIHSAYPGSVNFRTGDVKVNGVNKTLKQVFIENYKARGMSQEEAEEEANKKFITKFDDELGRYVTTFKDNTKHEMRIFYMERGWGASNLHMKFNLAAVEQGTVQLSKELDVNGTDMSDQVFATFPYQIWYKDPLYNPTDPVPGHEEEYVQLTEQTLGNHGSVKYLDSTKDVTYKQEIYVDNTNSDNVKCSVKYQGVYLVDPGETIVIKFPVFGETGSEQFVREYKIVECGVDPNVYPSVTLDDGTTVEQKSVRTNIRVDARDEHGNPTTITTIPEVDSGLCNCEIEYDTLDNRSKVRYKNNVEETEELLIQKNLYKKEGTAEPELIPKSDLYDDDGNPLDPENPDLRTTYDFRAYFKTPYDAEYSPANVYEYHVKDPGGYYCKWVPADPEHDNPNDPLSVGHFERILVEGVGIKDYAALANLDSDTLHHATFDTSINGTISQIPAYYDVELRGLIPGTQFKVVERPGETPEGYEFYRYEVNDDGTNLIVYPENSSGDIDPEEGVTGNITKGHDAQVLVDNYKGFALHLYKTWADASTIMNRDPAYFAVFYETTDPDTGETSRKLIDADDAVKQLAYSAKPQELSWFYLHLPGVAGVESPEFGKFVVREVTLTGNNITVGDDGVVSGYDSYTVVEEGGVVELKGTAKGAGAVEKLIPYKVTYAEPKTIGTNLREFRVTDTPSDKPAVKFLKEDWRGNHLAGATFTLKQGTTDIFPPTGKTSDSNGLISIEHLTENTDYVLKEIETPLGYYGLQEQLTLQLVADETEGWTLNVLPNTGDITDFYEVGVELETNDQGDETIKYVTLTLKNKPYHFEAIKTDGTNGDPLSGVKFELYEWKSSGGSGGWSNDPMKWDGSSILKTDENGVIPHLDEDLPVGTYQLREKEALDCYTEIGNVDFTINNMGVISLGTNPPAGVVLTATEGTGEHAGELVYTLTVPNTPKPLKLKKVDEAGQDLKGAKFELQKHNGTTWEDYDLPGTQSNVIDMTSTAVFDINKLPDGRYHLTELNAPTDYVITEDSIYFKITVEKDANGNSKRTVALTDESGTGPSTNPNATLNGPDDGVYTIVVKNTKGVPLPMTGGIGTTIFYVIGSLLVLICGVVLVARRRVRAHK